VRAPEGAADARHSGSDVYVEDCLYDLHADPHQRTNLVEDPAVADVRAGLRATLSDRILEAGEREPEILPAVSAENA
jgi:hypothetical protein